MLWSLDWVKHTEEINLAVGTKNRLTISGGKKRLVCPFRRQDLWRYIGYIILSVSYIWEERTQALE